MIKGINKQIIEIKCTDDEYFDKVLLFVRADRSGTPDGALRKNAVNLCGRMLPHYRTGYGKRRNTAKLMLLALAVTGAAALVVYALAICF